MRDLHRTFKVEADVLDLFSAADEVIAMLEVEELSAHSAEPDCEAAINYPNRRYFFDRDPALESLPSKCAPLIFDSTSGLFFMERIIWEALYAPT